MRGVQFGEYHSFLDFGLILTSYSIGEAKPKTETVDVPGADGVLDLTEYFGDVRYQNRALSFTFAVIGRPSEFPTRFSALQDAVGGRKLHITLDDDPDYYYVGRVTVDKWKSAPRVGSITITCDCEPYKYKASETVIVSRISGRGTVTYENLRKRVTPVFTASAPVSITFDGTTTDVGAGEFTLPAVEFAQGKNIVTYAGNAVVTVRYREGGL